MDWLQRVKHVYAQNVSRHNHRANVSERVVETGKHHLISGIAGTDENFPITQWDILIPQTQRTLNMMRPCRINPKLSADFFLEGQHDYNTVPFPPLGWRMIIFEGPDQRSSWGFHVVEGYSIGPAEPQEGPRWKAHGKYSDLCINASIGYTKCASTWPLINLG